MTSMEDLPEEVLSDVFVKLLAKEVAQMRCVSKSWNALLSHPSFIKSHLHHSIQNNDEILLFVRLKFSYCLNRQPFTARPSRSPNLELTNFIKPPPILEGKYGYGRLIGSGNGLICFAYLSDPEEFALHIWNPSLSAILSLLPFPLGSHQLHFGFGFDPKSDDYKILKLISLSQSPNKVVVGEVYSMRKRSWNLISLQTFPSHIRIPKGNVNQICVGDHLHWLCDADLEFKPLTILAFDLGEEAFIEIPFPDSILDFEVHTPDKVLGVLGGKLCVMSRVFRDGGKWEVWVMEEHGVSESWVKHHVFSQFDQFIVPYGFTSQGEFLFQAGVYKDRFGLYDPIAAMTKTFNIKGVVGLNKVVEYVDSLVWVPPPKCEIKVSNFSKLTKAIIVLVPRLKPLIHHFSNYLFGS